ncbi:glycosyltransferase family 2 protein [Agromyces sp. PvR057]|uniref:glycosyltransferase family 2 protein n=1 Tax=Agromyces sp. PvR057 TaxID=3156403 RepID=UPI000E2354A3
MATHKLEHVAVATVTYNSNDQVDAFLASAADDQRHGLSVVIADNGSVDRERLRTIASERSARLLELDSNLGYGGALNVAIAGLDPQIGFILISNPDVELRSGAVAALVEALESDEGIGAVGPKVLNADGTPYPSARTLPSLRTGVGHALFSRVWPANPWSRRYRLATADPDVRREAGWLSGSCLLVRRSAFESLGGFDDGFFMYFEDVDLGYRLGKAGWTNVYLPTATVMHTGAHSTTSESERMLQAHHDSAYRYLSKKYDAPYLAPVRWGLRIGLNARYRLLRRRATRP